MISSRSTRTGWLRESWGWATLSRSSRRPRKRLVPFCYLISMFLVLFSCCSLISVLAFLALAHGLAWSLFDVAIWCHLGKYFSNFFISCSQSGLLRLVGSSILSYLFRSTFSCVDGSEREIGVFPRSRSLPWSLLLFSQVDSYGRETQHVFSRNSIFTKINHY